MNARHGKIDAMFSVLPLSQSTGELYVGTERSGTWAYEGDKIGVCLSCRLPIGGIRKEMSIDGHAATVEDAKNAIRTWITEETINVSLFTETGRRYLR